MKNIKLSFDKITLKKLLPKFIVILLISLLILGIVNVILFFNSNMKNYPAMVFREFDARTFNYFADIAEDYFDSAVKDDPDIKAVEVTFAGINKTTVKLLGSNNNQIGIYNSTSEYDYEKLQTVWQYFSPIYSVSTFKVTRHQVSISVNDYALVHVRFLGTPRKYDSKYSSFYFMPKLAVNWYACASWD